MNKFSTIILSAVIGAVAAYGTVKLTNTQSATSAKETAFERVTRTNTLRCAYASVNPDIMVNQKTGNVEGYMVDVANAIAEKLGLKVEWVEEVGFADFAEGLKNGRYDAFCGMIAMAPHRSRAALFTIPTLYMPMYAYVRKDDDRFHSLADMNKDGIKSVVIDGEVFQVVTRKYLPNTTEYSLPRLRTY